MAEEESAAPVATTLGLERWVQFAFIAGALILFWLLDRVVHSVWDLVTEPDDRIITPMAAVLSVLTAVVLYRAPAVHRFSNEVAGELSKVSWPNRQETWRQTVVVIIVSLIAAVILGLFDAAWLAITNLIYQF